MDSNENKIALLEGRILALSTENARLRDRPSPSLGPQTPPNYSGGGSGSLPAAAKPSYATQHQHHKSTSLPPPLQHNVPLGPQARNNSMSRSLPAPGSPTASYNDQNEFGSPRSGGATVEGSADGGSLNSSLRANGFDAEGSPTSDPRADRQQREQRDLRAALLSQMSEVTRLKDSNRKEAEARRNMEQQLQLQKQEMYGLYSQVQSLQGNLKDQQHHHGHQMQQQSHHHAQQLHQARAEAQQSGRDTPPTPSSRVTRTGSGSGSGSGIALKDTAAGTKGGKKQQELQSELAKKEAEVTMLKNVLEKKDKEISKLKGESNDAIHCATQTDKIDRYATSCQTNPIDALPPLNSTRKRSPPVSGSPTADASASSSRSPKRKVDLDMDACEAALEKAVTGITSNTPFVMRLFAQAPANAAHTDPMEFLSGGGVSAGSFCNASITSVSSSNQTKPSKRSDSFKRNDSFEDTARRTPQAPVLGTPSGRWCDEAAEFDVSGGELAVPSPPTTPASATIGSFAGSYSTSPSAMPQDKRDRNDHNRGQSNRNGDHNGAGSPQQKGHGNSLNGSSLERDGFGSSRGGSFRHEGRRSGGGKRGDRGDGGGGRQSNGNSLNSNGGGGRGDSARNSLGKASTGNRWASGNAANSLRSDGGRDDK